MASTFSSKFKSFMTMSLPPKDEPLTNRPVNDPTDFAKPVKAISLPQDVPSTSDRRLIKLEHQVQRLMEAYIAPMQPTQVNKITSSCEICSGPHDTQYYMENPEQAFVEYASSRIDEAGVHQSNPQNDKPEEDERKGEGNPENTNAAELKEEQKDAPQPELKDPNDIKNIGPNRHEEEREIKWLDVEEYNNPQIFINVNIHLLS
ncbi:hypothetical protein Tco_0994423 [Tanacetum coccineum]